MSLPEPTAVLDLIHAFRRSKTMFAAVAMGIFDRLSQSPARSSELAAALGANPAAMEALLDSCAALGLLHKREGIYRNDAAAETYLVSTSPHTLSGYIRYSNQALYSMWGNLEQAVMEGTPRWKQTFGLEGPIFSSFFRTEDAKRDFLRGMHGFGMLTSPKIVEAFDLSPYRRMVDLGGATGHLVIAACEHYPNLRGVVLDLPEAVDSAREFVAASAARSRIEIRGADFFRDRLPDADLYSLGRILHDWNDETIAALLHKISDQLPANGALLIAEKLLNEDGVGPLGANMQCLNMLVVTEGRERSLSQYTHFLRRAGFNRITGRRTETPLDAILALKRT